ncbi:unnamed protein product [Lymnaea stagnalis]|uniref:Uncharacterized protein n=1 Tax=Lymnaea stagnalis TaxID=6523 RepID=A0AAV2II98_LYMST
MCTGYLESYLTFHYDIVFIIVLPMRKLIRYVRSQWKAIYDRPATRFTVIVLGTALGVGTYFYPILKTIMKPYDHLPEEQQSLYVTDNLYPVKVRKQREQE